MRDSEALISIFGEVFVFIISIFWFTYKVSKKHNPLIRLTVICNAKSTGFGNHILINIKLFDALNIHFPCCVICVLIKLA